MNKTINQDHKLLPNRVIVRPQTSWRSRASVILLVGVFIMMLSWGMYETGKNAVDSVDTVLSEEPDNSYHLTTCLQKKPESLCTQLAELTRQLQIVRTTNDDLIDQTRSLSKENNRLKEELNFFEHVMTGNTKIENGVSIHQFNLKKDANPGLYRYAVSLVQGGQRPKDFRGSLKFFVNLKQNDQLRTVLLTNKDAEQKFVVNFKFYHRVEESFKVPPDTEVESIKIELFQQGETHAVLTQIVEPS